MSRPLRIFYAAGPGDVVTTYRHWVQGRDDPSQVAITYSGQFYDVCRDIGAEARVVSYCPRRDGVDDGASAITVENRPTPFANQSAPLFHLGQLWSGLRLTASAVRMQADVVLTMGGAPWFSLGLLPWFGIKVIVALHGHLWRVTYPPRGLDKFVWRLNARFFRRKVSAVMFISDRVRQQLHELTGPLDIPELRFVPTYRPELFSAVDDAGAPPRPPFRVFYAGRIERGKGVFDVLEVARRLVAQGRHDVEFDLSGAGSALDELQRRAKEAGLSDRFRCHGHEDRHAMRRRYQQSHVVMVPTTSDTIEGLNKVVVEAVLASRPVVTSRMCPSPEDVRGAVVEVPPDDVAAYADAILRLADDPSFYAAKARAGANVMWKFYDPDQSWAQCLKRVFRKVGLLPTRHLVADAGMEAAGMETEESASMDALVKAP
jgi:glycogen(starch) synthase